jgi:hypothetical protein
MRASPALSLLRQRRGCNHERKRKSRGSQNTKSGHIDLQDSDPDKPRDEPIVPLFLLFPSLARLADHHPYNDEDKRADQAAEKDRAPEPRVENDFAASRLFSRVCLPIHQRVS